MDKKYIKSGTMQVCPYSDDIAIVTCDNGNVDTHQCLHHGECTIEHCPLAEEAKAIC